jgi:pyruvate/2-oxoglutarate/acetoin dehydrogenase E1 component
VLDLRWLSPLDHGAIDRAVEAAGRRVVIAHEANVSGGFGGEIAAQIAERHRGAIIRRIGSPNVRIPASPHLQAALLPNERKIIDAVRDVIAASRKSHEAGREPAKALSPAGAQSDCPFSRL